MYKVQVTRHDVRGNIILKEIRNITEGADTEHANEKHQRKSK